MPSASAFMFEESKTLSSGKTVTLYHAIYSFKDLEAEGSRKHPGKTEKEHLFNSKNLFFP